MLKTEKDKNIKLKRGKTEKETRKRQNQKKEPKKKKNIRTHYRNGPRPARSRMRPGLKYTTLMGGK
jgi:hypothetical protein